MAALYSWLRRNRSRQRAARRTISACIAREYVVWSCVFSLEALLGGRDLKSDAWEQDAATGTDDESQVILRAQAGDRAAFGLLVRRYQRRLFALGMRFFGNGDDAEDLVQDTFVRAWQALDRFDTARPFAPWLLRIASNRALTEIATRKRRGGVELDDDLPSPARGADEDLDRKQQRLAVERALQELPEDQRMILLLRTSEELSYRDIAATLDIPMGTVMSRLARAREALRRQLHGEDAG